MRVGLSSRELSEKELLRGNGSRRDSTCWIHAGFAGPASQGPPLAVPSTDVASSSGKRLNRLSSSCALCSRSTP